MDQLAGNFDVEARGDTRGAAPYVVARTPVPFPAAGAPARSGLSATDLLGLLDRWPGALAIVDGRSHVAHLNRAAERIMRRGDGLLLAAGRLRTGSPRLNRTLDAFLASGHGARPTSSDSLALRIERHGIQAPYRLIVAPLPKQVPTADPSADRFTVVMHEQPASRRIPLFVLTDLYDLSRAQALLAARLFAGDSLIEAAGHLSISIATARTHLRNIFAKCEVKSQAELLQLLALGPQH